MGSSERKKPHPFTTKGEATRTRIIEAAAKLIDRHGVGGTRLDDVMAASGASKSQLYHYFKDKDALTQEVIALQTTRVLAAHQPYLTALDSMAALLRWRDAMIKICRTRGGVGGCPVGSLANELSDQSEDARKLLMGSFESWGARIEDGLVQMRKQGVLKTTADPHDLSVAVLCAIQGGLLLAKTARDTRPFELALDMALEHVARNLR